MPSSWEKRETPWIRLPRMLLRMLFKNTRSSSNNRLQFPKSERKTRRLPQPHRQLDKKPSQLVPRQHLHRLREASLNNVEIDLREEIDHQRVIVLPGMDRRQETGLLEALDPTILVRVLRDRRQEPQLPLPTIHSGRQEHQVQVVEMRMPSLRRRVGETTINNRAPLV